MNEIESKQQAVRIVFGLALKQIANSMEAAQITVQGTEIIILQNEILKMYEEKKQNKEEG